MIYIRIDAGPVRGMGHLYRMLTLADRLAACRQPVTFVIRNDDATKKILDARGAGYKSFPSSMGEEEIIRKSLAGHGPLPDLWIFDLLDTDPVWPRSIRKKKIKVVSFDDTKGSLTEADLVINAIVHSWDAYEARDVKVPLREGLAYAIINPSAIRQRRKRVIAREGPLAVAITMGGSDTHASSLAMLEALADRAPDSHRIHLFTGPGFSHERELSSLVNSLSRPVSVRRAVPDLHRELNPMDVVICSGGVTLLEVCAMGLPALAFAGELHEEKNIRYLSSLKACLPIGSICTVDTKRLKDKIGEFLSNRDLLNETASSAMRCVGDGTDACAQAICGLFAECANGQER